MNWDEIKKKIGEVAPTVLETIGAFVPGPAGIVTGVAGKILRQVFGTDKVSELENAIQTDPNLSLKLREAEIAAQLELMRIEKDTYALQLLDVQSARDREKEYWKSLGHADYSMEILGWLIVAGFFIILGIRLYVEIPSTQLENVGILMGFLGAGFMAVVQYKFGSSAGSAAKSKAMEVNAILKNGK